MAANLGMVFLRPLFGASQEPRQELRKYLSDA